MADKLKLDYYYGDEPEKFCFYRIPKVLFTKAYFEGLSTDAKVLYGLMLDMMSSSRSNRWLDKENRVYIQFSMQRAMAYLGCGKDKAIKLFAELDNEKGIGLIERIDRGQGKADLIYVKSFEIPDEADDTTRIEKFRNRKSDITLGPTVLKLKDSEVDKSVDNPQKNVDNINLQNNEVVGKSDRSEKPTTMGYGKVVGNLDRSGNQTTAGYEKVVGKSDRSEKPTTMGYEEVVGKSDRSENQTSRSRKNRPLEFGKTDPNNTNFNKTNILIRSSSAETSYPDDTNKDDDMTDYSRPIPVTGSEKNRYEFKFREMYVDLLKDQTRYEELINEKPYCFDKDKIDGIINIIADIAVTKPRDGVEWINSRPYGYEVVRERLLKTDYETITFVLDRLGKNTTKIRNMRKYLLTALYNAPDEMEMSIAAQAGYDMYGGEC